MVSNFMMSNQKTNRSNPPGTKSQDFYKWTEQNLEDMDSTLAVQQYIQQMIRRDYTDTDAILTMPVGQDEGVWKYEQLRQFCLELNGLAVKLQDECHPSQCWQMTATDQWIFLCAAHKTPQECAAIDYTRHTLDGAACLLNSNKYFPSRVNIKESSVNKLGSVCRRVYRIFSHAYYHHRQVFDETENETYLCRRFTKFVTKYELMSHENLIVPIFSTSDDDEMISAANHPVIMKKNDQLLQFGGGFADIPHINLPPGVGPDDDDDENEGMMMIDNFIDSPAQEVDDDFSFTLGSSGVFGTMKPMKKSHQQLPQVAVAADETLTSEDVDVDDPSFVDMMTENNNTTTTSSSSYLTLSNDNNQPQHDDTTTDEVESDC